MDNKELVQLLRFCFDNRCLSFYELYESALYVLKEQPVTGWKYQDVVDAVIRANNKMGEIPFEIGDIHA